MNSINNGWDTNEQKCLIFIVIPQIITKARENGKPEKSMRTDKSKENTSIYPYVYMHTATDTETYNHTNTHIRIVYYSSQIVLFDIMFESI